MTDDREYRWKEDARILSLCPAPPGWWALFRKSEEERESIGSRRETARDLAWVEPVSLFALVQVMEREIVITGRDEELGIDLWEYTGRDERDVRNAGGESTPRAYNHWPHTAVRAVWWHSGEETFAGVDELMWPSSGPRPDLIIGPNSGLEDEWVLDRLR